MEATTTTSGLQNVLDDFRSRSFSVVSDVRKKAIQQFETLGFPTAKSEEYRFTPLAQKLHQKFVWNTHAVPSTLTDITKYLIPNVDGSIVVMNNGKFDLSLSRIQPETGLIISGLDEAFTKHSALVHSHFNTIQPDQHDAFASLNSALWSDGVFIHVAENCAIKNPILVVYLFDAQAASSIHHTRSLVLLEKNAKASICERFDVVGTNGVYHNLTEEIKINAQAELEYCRIQHDAGNFYQVSNTTLLQTDKSKLNTFTLTLDGQLIRNNFNIVIDGEHCESHFYGLYLLHGNTLADNHTVVDHRKPNSFSNEMYKGVMDGSSKGVFNGKIFVRPQAQKTNAFQSNRNIILSESATVNTKPQLEIWADDVKCSHGCTSGQLDEEALFYLQSRGIGQATAKAMLLYAFAHEVLEPVKHEGLKLFLDQLIANRLHKNF